MSSGFILPFGGGSAPSGWFECDGAAVSVALILFAIIGTIYGAGDGSTTFNVPIYKVAWLWAKEETLQIEHQLPLKGLVTLLENKASL